jgi:hypothetical protein
MRTMCWSLASNCLLLLPSSTSCSKFDAPPETSPLFSAPLIELRQVVELDLVARDVVRIGDDAADVLAQDGHHLRLPVALEGLGGGDHHLVGPDLDRQDAEARGVGIAHHLGHRRHIDLQRIDVQIFEPAPVRHPLRQVRGRACGAGAAATSSAARQ